jgi:hypothetical protein
MREFDIALHHNITVLRKKRLIVLMRLPNPSAISGRASESSQDDNGIAIDCSLVTYSLRLYLSQYTYVDCSANDWFTRLLYTLPLTGLLNKSREDDVGERTPLLGSEQCDAAAALQTFRMTPPSSVMVDLRAAAASAAFAAFAAFAADSESASRRRHFHDALELRSFSDLSGTVHLSDNLNDQNEHR